MKVEKFFGYLFNVGPREAQHEPEPEADVEVEAVAEVGKVSSGASVCA